EIDSLEIERAPLRDEDAGPLGAGELGVRATGARSPQRPLDGDGDVGPERDDSAGGDLDDGAGVDRDVAVDLLARGPALAPYERARVGCRSGERRVGEECRS